VSFRLAVARNLLKAWLIFLVPAGLLGALGWEIGDYRVALLFGGSVFLLGAVLYWYADRIAMGMLGARELLPGEAPALHVTVESLALRARVVPPKLYLVLDAYPRAASAGRGAQGGAALAVSSGLLGVATPAELEAIVAHELTHLRARDVLPQTIVSVLAGAIVESSRIGGYFQRGFLFVLGPLAASFVHLVLSPKREYDADLFSAELCGGPHSMADALLRLEGAMGVVQFAGSPATEPLYTVNPFADEGLGALFNTHPKLGDRVERLRDLDPEWRERLRAA
jgi:heat shock protein HtpX